MDAYNSWGSTHYMQSVVEREREGVFVQRKLFSACVELNVRSLVSITKHWLGDLPGRHASFEGINVVTLGHAQGKVGQELAVG